MAAGRINVRWKQAPNTSGFPDPLVGVELFGSPAGPGGSTGLYWQYYVHTDVPRPTCVVLHIGEYKYGEPGPSNVATDLYYAGYNAVSAQYRLADPGHEMHAAPANQPVGDHGIFPEQVQDVAEAVDVLRLGTNGVAAVWSTDQVILVGGSAGASHAAHCAGASVTVNGVPIAQADAAVCLSAAFNYQLDSPPGIGNDPNGDFRNYCGCTIGAPCDGVGGTRDLCSPYQQWSLTSSPILIFDTNNDPIRYWQGDFMRTYLDGIGFSYGGRRLTEAAFQSNGGTRHAFQYWTAQPGFPDEVATETIAWLQALIPPP
jgi:acetyl esterase/lipase